MDYIDKLNEIKQLPESDEIKYLVMTDFDQTLQPHEDHGYTKSVEMMLELQKRGYICGVITGRPGNNFKAKCKELKVWDLYKQLDYIITDNGNSAYIPRSAQSFINKGIDPAIAMQVIDYAREKKLAVIVNTNHGVFSYGVDDANFDPLSRLLYSEIEYFELEKFSGMFLQLNVGEPVSESTLQLPDKVFKSAWDDNFYAVALMGGKANAYQALIEHHQELGTTFEKMYAFGDFTNDIDMFNVQGVESIAVSNAHPDLKAIASRVSEYAACEDAVCHELYDICKENLV